MGIIEQVFRGLSSGECKVLHVIEDSNDRKFQLLWNCAVNDVTRW